MSSTLIKSLTISFALFHIACLPRQSKESQLQSQNRIMSGDFVSSTDPIALSTVALLEPDQSKPDAYRSYCTGTVIAPLWILTAGHCVVDLDHFLKHKERRLAAPEVTVSFFHSFEGMELHIKSKKIIYHEDFVYSSSQAGISMLNDIALIQLAQPIPKKSKIIPRITHLVEPGTEVILAGYGKNEDAEPFLEQYVTKEDETIRAFDAFYGRHPSLKSLEPGQNIESIKSDLLQIQRELNRLQAIELRTEEQETRFSELMQLQNQKETDLPKRKFALIQYLANNQVAGVDEDTSPLIVLYERMNEAKTTFFAKVTEQPLKKTKTEVYRHPNEQLLEFKTPSHGKNSSCNGDSGGPMFLVSEKGLELLGSTSSGSGSCYNTGLYTNIVYFNRWIDQKISGPKIP